jgi:hypothetical protein
VGEVLFCFSSNAAYETLTVKGMVKPAGIKKHAKQHQYQIQVNTHMKAHQQASILSLVVRTPIWQGGTELCYLKVLKQHWY